MTSNANLCTLPLPSRPTYPDRDNSRRPSHGQLPIPLSYRMPLMPLGAEKKKVPRQRAKTQRTRLHPTCRRGRCALAGQSTRHAPGHRYVRGRVYPLGFVSRIWGKMQDSIIFMAIWLLSYLRLPFHIVLPSRSLLGMSLLVALLRVQDAQNGKKQVDDIEVQRNGRRNLLLHMVVPHNHLRVQQNVA